MRQIKLVATDYDDTLVGRDSSMVMMGEFKRALDTLREEHGSKWAIVTGRHFGAMTTALKMFARRGLHPDFLVVSEGYIFVRSTLGYFPMLSWNFNMWKEKRRIKKRLREVVKGWKTEIAKRWPNAKNKSLGASHLWYLFEDVDECYEAEKYLGREIAAHPELIIFNRENELYMGITFCCKGMALGEVARKADISLFNIFAVGDGPNDVSMLNGSSAQMVACVGNACDQLKEAVGKVDGYIAEQDNVLGVVESLKYYREQMKK